MRSEELLSPFQKRLRMEGMLSSLIWGLSGGMACAFLYLLVYHFMGRKPDDQDCLILLIAGMIILSSLLYAFHFRPTQRTTAKRLDAMGLEERIMTMVEFQNQDRAILQVQKADAKECLKKIKAEQVRIKIDVRGVICFLIVLCFTIGIYFIPYTWFRAQQYENGQIMSEEARMIQELLAEMRAKVENANLSDAERIRMMAQIEALEADWTQGEASLEALAEAMEASGELITQLDQIKELRGWAHVLWEFECLRPLAEAMMTGEMEAEIKPVVVKMYESVLYAEADRQLDQMNELDQSIKLALDMDPPNDDEAYLGMIFDTFANLLEEACSAVYSKNTTAARKIYNAYNNLESGLAYYYGGTELLETVTGEEAEHVVYYNSAQLVDEEGDAGVGMNGDSAGDEAQQPQEGDERHLLYTSDQEALKGAGTGISYTQHFVETESIYEYSLDPTFREDLIPGIEDEDAEEDEFYQVPPEKNEGMVPYGQVIGNYYYKFYEQIQNEAIPEEWVNLVENYLNML